MATFYFLNKKSSDLPEKVSDSEMYDIFCKSKADNFYTEYKERRSKLVRFASLTTTNNDLLDCWDIYTANKGECKYFWDGNHYVKYDGPWVTFNSEEKYYILPEVKYLVYISYEDKPDGRKYVGSFTHKKGMNDDYLGSYTDNEFKPDKRVDVYKCATRKEAYQKERELQISLDVVNNPIYVNKVIVEEQH